MGCCCWHHGTDALDCCQSDSTCHPDICGSADDHPEVCGSADEHPEVPSFCVTRHDGADFHYGCGHGRCTFVKNSSFERMLVEMGQAGFLPGIVDAWPIRLVSGRLLCSPDSPSFANTAAHPLTELRHASLRPWRPRQVVAKRLVGLTCSHCRLAGRPSSLGFVHQGAVGCQN